MRLSSKARLLPVVALLVLLGCGDTEISAPGQSGGGGCGVLGTSNIAVNGAAAATLNACAIFAVIPATTSAPASFGLNLTAGSSSAPTHLLSITRNGTRPPNGTYTVGVAAGNIQGALNMEDGTDRVFVLTGGSITITQSTASTLVGTVNLTGTESTGPTPTTATMTGNFSARCLDTSSSDC